MKRGNSFNVDSPYFRVRSDRALKVRYAAIGTKRGCDPTAAAREGLIQFADSEEKRLGIVPAPSDEAQSTPAA